MSTPFVTRSARKMLLTGPAGCGKTHHALERIRAAATRPGPRGRGAAAPGEALLVLPTYAQVMHVKRLALSRWDVRGLLDQPFTTFTAAGERFLPAFRVRALPSAEERDRLMEEALRQRPEPVFTRVADRPGFRAHLLRLVKELKQSGLEGGEARQHLAAAAPQLGPSSRAKLAAFLSVFELYEDLLERAGLEDHEDALRRLARRLEEQPPAAPPGLLVVDGFDDFSRVEERILRALTRAVEAGGGDVLVTLPWDAARPHVFAMSRGARERLLADGFEEQRLTGFARSESPALAAVAARLFGDGQGGPVHGGDDVQLFEAGDAEDEAETVVRAVRALHASGTPAAMRGWRDVGVVVRRLEDHAPRLEAAFARLGVPLRVVGAGEVLGGEPIVRALRGPMAVLAGRGEAGRFDAGGLMEWLRWRALYVGDVPADALDRWDVAQRTRGFAADFDSFRAQAPAALGAALEALSAHAAALAGAQGSSAVYSGLAEALEVLAPLPEPAGFDAAGRLLDAAHDRRLARTVLARARMLDVLRALRSAMERTRLGGASDVEAAVRELQEALERTTLRVPDRRLDAVTLMDAEEARFWDLPVVIVAGLEEGRFPLRPREDVLLRDRDRAALCKRDPSLRLPLAREREARERRLFYGAVTRAGTRLALVRRVYDDKGDPRERSLYLRELERVVMPSLASRARSPGRVAREADECFTRTDWRLHAAARLGPWVARGGERHGVERARAAALQSLAGSEARERAARQRRCAADPLWSAAPEREAVLARFAAATEEVSVSRLNHAALCPHRFFLAYVAAVPQDDLTLDGPVFDQRQMGSALHHAFELALRHSERQPSDLARAGVTHVGAQGLQARLLEAELKRAVELLRDRERRTAGVLAPWADALELRFRGPSAVELGPPDCRWRLGGAMDRVDRGTDSQGRAVAAVVDYKRSATSADAAEKGTREGRDLQLPLYARALEVMHDLRVVGLEWVAGLTRARRIIHDVGAAGLFAGRREASALTGLEHEAFRALMEAAEAAATAAVRRARLGDQERRPTVAGTCVECPWKDACRPDVAALDRVAREAQAAAGDA